MLYKKVSNLTIFMQKKVSNSTSFVDKWLKSSNIKLLKNA